MFSPSYKRKYLEQLVRVNTVGLVKRHSVKSRSGKSRFRRFYCAICYSQLKRGGEAPVEAVKHAEIKSPPYQEHRQVKLHQHSYGSCVPCCARSLCAKGGPDLAQYLFNDRLVTFYQSYFRDA